MMNRITLSLYLTLIAAVVAVLIFAVLPAPAVRAAVFTVANGDVAGLVAAINSANNEVANPGPDTIELAAGGTYILTTANNSTGGFGNNGLPALTSQITINGNGATIGRDTVGGTPAFRIFFVQNTGSLTLNNLTVSNGNSVADGGSGGNSGGAIFNNGGTLTLNSSMVLANSATFGGAVYNNGGAVTVTNSTLSSNTATASSGASGGAAIYNDGGASTVAVTGSTFVGNTATGDGGSILNAGGTLNVTNSTFSGNSGAPGGGVFNAGVLDILNSTFSGNGSSGLFNGSSGTATLRNTIIANSTSGGNCGGAGTISSSSTNNLATDNTCGSSFIQTTTAALNIGPLANNGGPTQTMMLGPASTAIDAGTNVGCPPTDQRGVIRPQDGDSDGIAICDIGAHELEGPATPTPTPALTDTPTSTATNTSTPTSVPTNTPTPTDTPTVTSTPTSTPAPTDTPTSTPTSTPTPTRTPTPTSTPTQTPTRTPTSTPTPTRTPTQTSTPTPTPTRMPTSGPRGVKQNVLADLLALQASVTDKHDRQELGKAIKHLAQSLIPAYWIDGNHPQPKAGDKVFSEEKDAVNDLRHLMKERKSTIPRAVLQDFINRIVSADHDLASVAIGDAVSRGGAPRDIAQANAELARGDRDAAEGKYESAIEHYRNAWQHALKALKR